MAYIGRGLDKISNVEKLDNLTFDGSSTSYSLLKGGVSFTPSSANNILLSIDGVVQAGNFTVSGSTIDFGTAVSASSTCDFILHYGVGVITTPADGTVTTAKLADSSVSLAKLTATGTKDATTFLRGDNTFATPTDNGKILQVVYATDTSIRTTTSTSFVTASNTATVSITPSSISSKIFVICTGNFNASDGDDGWSATIYRDATNLGNATVGLAIGNSVPGITGLYYNTTMTILDSPNTTSSITYQLYFKTINQDGDGSTGSALGQPMSGSTPIPTHITAFEVGA